MTQSTTTPAWDELSKALRAAMTPAELKVREEQAAGYGPTHHHMTKRLFDAPPDYKPRVTFYRDQNVWCPFCETMWLYLEEKRIPYTAVKVNKERYGSRDEWYWKMGARGVPSVQIDNGPLISGANFFAIEQRFPENPLIPADDDPAVDLWAPMEATSGDFGNAFWGLNKAEISGPVVKSAPYKAFVAAADKLNDALGAHGGPYLLGEKLSILDVQFSRSAERAAAMLPYNKGVPVRRNERWPHLERWYEAMESRPTYKNIVSDFWTHVAATPLQVPFLVGPKHADGAALAAEIGGTDGSWTLPLPEDDGTALEPLSTLGQTAEEARREAAERIVHNHRAVVGFAARGVLDAHAVDPGSRDRAFAAKHGKRLPPTQSGAEIGRTNLGSKYGGTDGLETEAEVASDVALRFAVRALLDGPSEKLVAAIAAEALPAGIVKASLGYLRDRISVPRDMGYPAARQARAHLNYVISAVEGGGATPTETPKQCEAMTM